MRFGISATSWIFPKNLRTRLRPVNVCAMLCLSPRRTAGTGTTLRKAAIHRDRQDRRRARAVHLCMIRPDAESINRNRRQAVYGAIPGLPEITVLCSRAPRQGGRPAIARNPTEYGKSIDRL